MSLKKVNEKEVVEEDIVDTDEDTATKRLNNAVKGTTLFNHPQALEKKNKDNKKDQQSQS